MAPSNLPQGNVPRPAPTSNPPQGDVPRPSNAAVAETNHESVVEFRAPVNGLIRHARGAGQVFGVREFVYTDGGIVEETQVPPRRSNPVPRRYEAANRDGVGSSGHGDRVVFYEPVSGLVLEADGAVSVTAQERHTINGRYHFNNPVQNPGAGSVTAQERHTIDGRYHFNNPVQNPAIQQHGPLWSQETNGIAEGSSESSILGLNHPILEPAPRIRANNFPRTTEGQHAQSRADSRQQSGSEMGSTLREELQHLSPEMQAYITMLEKGGGQR